MRTRFRLRSWLLGLALGVLLTLLIAPQTRWLVRVQWAASLGLYHPFPWCQPDADSYTLSLRSDQAREDAVASWHPGDFPIQLAHASEGAASSVEVLARARALKARFPRNPSLDANALRYATFGAVQLHRDADYLLGGQPIPKREPFSEPPPSVEQLALFDKDAADGERLEPDNAFFPFMRAVGLFAAHQDAEALAAVRRAGIKTQWNEHLTDEPEGQWRLHAEAFGDPNALWRVQAMSNVVLPEYRELRAVARVATYQAVLDEQAGRTQDGLAIRHALMRCGGLMRTQSTLIIGTLVGMAITQVAMSRPGGIPAPTKQPPTRTPGEVFRRRADAYIAYLHRVGQNDEARWVQSEAEAAQQARAIIGNIDMVTLAKSPLSRLVFRLTAFWVVALLVISNILWTLVLGGLASLLRRKNAPAQPESSRPLSAATPFLWAILALLAEIAVLAALMNSDVGDSMSLGGELLLLAVIVVTIALFVLMAFAGRTKREALTRRLRAVVLAFALTALGLGVLIGAAHWQTQSAVSVVRLNRAYLGLSGDGMSQTLQHDWAPDVSIAASLAAPLLILLTSLGVSLTRRASFRETLRSGFRMGGLPIACVLVIVYGALALGTLRQERAVNDGLQQMVQHEGRYYAALAGQTWPDATP